MVRERQAGGLEQFAVVFHLKTLGRVAQKLSLNRPRLALHQVLE